MVKKPEVLAIIPARGGSKGIPRKNIKPFAGAPLLAWSIQAAKDSSWVSRVIVSTDDEEIAQVARDWGAETPFLRPAELAEDISLDYPLFKQALEWLEENEAYSPEIIVQLRPTSPIRPKGLVDQAVEKLLAEPAADSVRGVVPSGQNPYKMWFLDETTGRLLPLMELPEMAEPYNAARQSLPKTYWQTGHIDAFRRETVLDKGSLSGDLILSLLIDPRYTVDIDQPSDWPKYEALVGDRSLEMTDPLKGRRSFPEKVSALMMDFDGVLTDDAVFLDDQGHEFVRAHRGDGMGLNKLRTLTDIVPMIISRDISKVSHARAAKVKIEAFSGVMEKGKKVDEIAKERGWKKENLIFVGNDLPDLETYDDVGYFVCTADARPELLRRADLVLQKPGGHGAIREICDLLVEKFGR